MGRQRSQTTVPGGAQEERVAGYLLEHPGFFDRHPETLLKLELCRRTDGRVASLVERQVARLRERNRELEGSLGDLLEAVGDNERLVERIHRLTIGLLAPSSAAQRIGILHRRLKRDFEVERAALILFAAPADVQPDNGFVRIVDRRDPGLRPFARLLETARPRCGPLRPQQKAFAFGERGMDLHSAAMIPLGQGAGIGTSVPLGSRRAGSVSVRWPITRPRRDGAMRGSPRSNRRNAPQAPRHRA